MCTYLCLSFLESKIRNPATYVGITEEINFQQQDLEGRLNPNHTICGSMAGIKRDGIVFTCAQPLLGKYVFVDSYFDGREHRLGLAEVEVFTACNSNN